MSKDNGAFKDNECKNFILKSYEGYKSSGNKEALGALEILAAQHKIELPKDVGYKVIKSHVDPGLGIIYLIANRADVYDKAGHKIELQELRKGAIDYVKNSRKGDGNHNEQQSSEVVESLVFDDPIIKAVKEGEIVAGDWVVGMEPQTDELLQKALNGEIKGASIAGRGVLIDAKE